MRGSNRTVPIRLIHAGQHPFDHVFCLIVESLCFGIATATCFQISEDGQVARHIITITNLLACGHALSGTCVRCG